MSKQNLNFYVGSWGNGETRGEGEGVYACRLNLDNGEMTLINTLEVKDPSVLAISKDNKYLYATNEQQNFGGGYYNAGGGVTSMKIEEDGSVSLLDQTYSMGSIPAYLSVDNTGKYVCVANHGSFQIASRYVEKEDRQFVCERVHDDSNFALFKIQPDGTVVPRDIYHLDTIGSWHTYKDNEAAVKRDFPGKHFATKMRLQGRPNAHFIAFKDNGIGVACDRASDMIYLFRINQETDRYEKIFEYHTLPATAPRHVAFHPTLPLFYTTNEMEASVSVYRFNDDYTSFEEVQRIRNIDEDITSTNGPTDIHIHPSGKYLYCASIFTNILAIYSVDQQTGLLSIVEMYHIGKPLPRGFGIDPTGKYLLIANMNSNSIDSFLIKEDGRLELCSSIEVKTPTCICFENLED